MSRTSARVSVVIPAFNAEATLSQTLESVKQQRLADWEAIVVDDGSTDATLDRARSIARTDARIRVMSQTHSGASAARNLGIEHARARWLVFLDADDWLAPDHLAQLLHALEVGKAQIAYCDHARVRTDGATIAIESCPELAERAFEIFAQRSAAAIHCFMVHRDLVQEVGGFDALTTCEDWGLWQRIARTGVRFVHVPVTLAYYQMRPGSLSYGRRQMIRDAVEVIFRARRPDPRVRRPLAEFASGVQTTDEDESAALFAVWCAAAEAARGIDASNLLQEIPRRPDLSHRLADLSTSILNGMISGGQLLRADVAVAWPRTCAFLLPTLALLERASARQGLSYELRSILERRLIDDFPLPDSLALTVRMSIRVDLQRRIESVVPPPGIDVINCRICAGDLRLDDVELPAFGPITARALAETVVETIGWRHTVAHGYLLRGRRFWITFARQCARALPALTRAAAVRLTGRRAGIRGLAGGVLRESTRRALTAECDRESSMTSESRASEILAAARAEALANCGQRAVARFDQHSSAEEGRLLGRKDYWEKTFELPDPWGYESVYETRKYAQTLSLLGDASITCALELGCAEGIFTRLLAPKVQRLIAADISERALDRARERCRDHRNIEFRQIDFFDAEVPRDVDLIVCSEVLYFLADKTQLKAVARKLADALTVDGHLLTAHAFLLADNPSRTGFDWPQPFGAATISAAFRAAGLTLEKSIRTELYCVDLFRRSPLPEHVLPSVTTESFGSPLTPEVESGVVWGGAAVRRADVAGTETIEIPVLLYHRVTDEGPAALFDYRITPRLFEEQMRHLRRHGFHTVTSADIERHRLDRRPMHGRPVLITFDDGYRDFYEVAWPILRRCGFTAEVFVPTDFVGGTAEWDRPHGGSADLMGWDDIRSLHKQGVGFGSHLATHAPATAVDSESLLRDGARSRAVLEAQLGSEVRAVAPPHGGCDERVVRILQACGYTQIFTTDPGPATVDRWSATVPRIAISNRDTVEAFASRLGAAVDGYATDAPLVTAVIPAFNALTTIDETLRSVRAQTHRNLEIIVVDDGSTDGTTAAIEAHAREDARVHLIRQANGGVAAARNRGVAESRADYIAPVDADDLWMPTKIEKQIEAMLRRGPRCGLVYTWQTTIDEHGHVVEPRRRWDVEGHVLPRMLFGNLVGSGSPALMRKQAIVEAGGYDASMRERGAQGCEDFKLYLQISERYEFAVIKEYLTGYRALPDAMSMDLLQMVRADELVGEYAERKHPHYTRLIRSGRIYFQQTQFRRALRHRRFRTAAILLARLVRRSPWHTLHLLAETPRRIFRYAVRRNANSNREEIGEGIGFLPQFDHPISDAPALSARQQPDALP